jgi:ABC-type thiamine transport system substrate-binding protein
MAFTAYHSVTGSTGVNIELIAVGEGVSSINSIVIANTHATADATVSMFIQNEPTAAASNTFYIFKTVAIPSDTSLLLDNKSMLSFDNSTVGYGLYLTVGGSDTLDVMINR